jgi:hypothetical protein
MTSEFGSGFVYPLALFLCHTERLYSDLARYKEMEDKYRDGLFSPDRAAQMWLYGAADHMYEFEPNHAPTAALRLKAGLFRRRCLKHRLVWRPEPNPLTVHGANVLIKQGKQLMLEIDEVLGVNPLKASWD